MTHNRGSAKPTHTVTGSDTANSLYVAAIHSTGCIRLSSIPPSVWESEETAFLVAPLTHIINTATYTENTLIKHLSEINTNSEKECFITPSDRGVNVLTLLGYRDEGCIFSCAAGVSLDMALSATTVRRRSLPTETSSDFPESTCSTAGTTNSTSDGRVVPNWNLHENVVTQYPLGNRLPLLSSRSSTVGGWRSQRQSSVLSCASRSDGAGSTFEEVESIDFDLQHDMCTDITKILENISEKEIKQLEQRRGSNTDHPRHVSHRTYHSNTRNAHLRRKRSDKNMLLAGSVHWDRKSSAEESESGCSSLGGRSNSSSSSERKRRVLIEDSDEEQERLQRQFEESGHSKPDKKKQPDCKKDSSDGTSSPQPPQWVLRNVFESLARSTLKKNTSQMSTDSNISSAWSSRSSFSMANPYQSHEVNNSENHEETSSQIEYDSNNFSEIKTQPLKVQIPAQLAYEPPVASMFRPVPQAEDMLMNLGFGGVGSFLPDRFAKDWYTKIQQAKRECVQQMVNLNQQHPLEGILQMQQHEQQQLSENPAQSDPTSVINCEKARNTQESSKTSHQGSKLARSLSSQNRVKRNAANFLRKLDLNSRTNAYCRRSKWRRAVSALSSSFSEITDTDNEYSITTDTDSGKGRRIRIYSHMDVQKQDSLDQLKYVLEKHNQILQSGSSAKKSDRRRQFSRQKSLPLFLETLSEEDEGSRKVSPDEFKKCKKRTPLCSVAEAECERKHDYRCNQEPQIIVNAEDINNLKPILSPRDLEELKLCCGALCKGIHGVCDSIDSEYPMDESECGNFSYASLSSFGEQGLSHLNNSASVASSLSLLSERYQPSENDSNMHRSASMANSSMASSFDLEIEGATDTESDSIIGEYNNFRRRKKSDNSPTMPDTISLGQTGFARDLCPSPMSPRWYNSDYEDTPDDVNRVSPWGSLSPGQNGSSSPVGSLPNITVTSSDSYSKLHKQSSASLEVEEIMAEENHGNPRVRFGISEEDLAEASRHNYTENIYNAKTKRPDSLAIEPAMVSIVLNDIHDHNTFSPGSYPTSSEIDTGESILRKHKPLCTTLSDGSDDIHLRAPSPSMSNLSSSPVPLSPITVIEMEHLDNVNDSIDSADGSSCDHNVILTCSTTSSPAHHGSMLSSSVDLLHPISEGSDEGGLSSKDISRDPSFEETCTNNHGKSAQTGNKSSSSKSSFDIEVCRNSSDTSQSSTDHNYPCRATSKQIAEGGKMSSEERADVGVEVDDGYLTPIELLRSGEDLESAYVSAEPSTAPSSYGYQSSPSSGGKSGKQSLDLGVDVSPGWRGSQRDEECVQTDDRHLSPLMFIRKPSQSQSLLLPQSPVSPHCQEADFYLAYDREMQCDDVKDTVRLFTVHRQHKNTQTDDYHLQRTHNYNRSISDFEPQFLWSVGCQTDEQKMGYKAGYNENSLDIPNNSDNHRTCEGGKYALEFTKMNTISGLLFQNRDLLCSLLCSTCISQLEQYICTAKTSCAREKDQHRDNFLNSSGMVTTITQHQDSQFRITNEESTSFSNVKISENTSGGNAVEKNSDVSNIKIFNKHSVFNNNDNVNGLTSCIASIDKIISNDTVIGNDSNSFNSELLDFDESFQPRHNEGSEGGQSSDTQKIKISPTQFVQELLDRSISMTDYIERNISIPDKYRLDILPVPGYDRASSVPEYVGGTTELDSGIGITETTAPSLPVIGGDTASSSELQTKNANHGFQYGFTKDMVRAVSTEIGQILPGANNAINQGHISEEISTTWDNNFEKIDGILKKSPYTNLDIGLQENWTKDITLEKRVPLKFSPNSKSDQKADINDFINILPQLEGMVTSHNKVIGSHEEKDSDMSLYYCKMGSRSERKRYSFSKTPANTVDQYNVDELQEDESYTSSSLMPMLIEAVDTLTASPADRTNTQHQTLNLSLSLNTENMKHKKLCISKSHNSVLNSKTVSTQNEKNSHIEDLSVNSRRKILERKSKSFEFDTPPKSVTVKLTSLKPEDVKYKKPDQQTSSLDSQKKYILNKRMKTFEKVDSWLNQSFNNEAIEINPLWMPAQDTSPYITSLNYRKQPNNPGGTLSDNAQQTKNKLVTAVNSCKKKGKRKNKSVHDHLKWEKTLLKSMSRDSDKWLKYFDRLDAQRIDIGASTDISLGLITPHPSVSYTGDIHVHMLSGSTSPQLDAPKMTEGIQLKPLPDFKPRETYDQIKMERLKRTENIEQTVNFSSKFDLENLLNRIDRIEDMIKTVTTTYNNSALDFESVSRQISEDCQNIEHISSSEIFQNSSIFTEVGNNLVKSYNRKSSKIKRRKSSNGSKVKENYDSIQINNENADNLDELRCHLSDYMDIPRGNTRAIDDVDMDGFILGYTGPTYADTNIDVKRSVKHELFGSSTLVYPQECIRRPSLTPMNSVDISANGGTIDSMAEIASQNNQLITPHMYAIKVVCDDSSITGVDHNSTCTQQLETGNGSTRACLTPVNSLDRSNLNTRHDIVQFNTEHQTGNNVKQLQVITQHCTMLHNGLQNMNSIEPSFEDSEVKELHLPQFIISDETKLFHDLNKLSSNKNGKLHNYSDINTDIAYSNRNMRMNNDFDNTFNLPKMSHTPLTPTNTIDMDSYHFAPSAFRVVVKQDDNLWINDSRKQSAHYDKTFKNTNCVIEEDFLKRKLQEIEDQIVRDNNKEFSESPYKYSEGNNANSHVVYSNQAAIYDEDVISGCTAANTETSDLLLTRFNNEVMFRPEIQRRSSPSVEEIELKNGNAGKFWFHPIPLIIDPISDDNSSDRKPVFEDRSVAAFGVSSSMFDLLEIAQLSSTSVSPNTSVSAVCGSDTRSSLESVDVLTEDSTDQIYEDNVKPHIYTQMQQPMTMSHDTAQSYVVDGNNEGHQDKIYNVADDHMAFDEGNWLKIENAEHVYSDSSVFESDREALDGSSAARLVKDDEGNKVHKQKSNEKYIANNTEMERHCAVLSVKMPANENTCASSISGNHTTEDKNQSQLATNCGDCNLEGEDKSGACDLQIDEKKDKTSADNARKSVDEDGGQYYHCSNTDSVGDSHMHSINDFHRSVTEEYYDKYCMEHQDSLSKLTFTRQVRSHEGSTSRRWSEPHIPRSYSVDYCSMTATQRRLSFGKSYDYGLDDTI